MHIIKHVTNHAITTSFWIFLISTRRLVSLPEAPWWRYHEERQRWDLALHQVASVLSSCPVLMHLHPKTVP